MSSKNGAGGESHLDAALEHLIAAYTEAHAEAERIAAQMAQARAHEKHALAAIRALDPEHPVVQSAAGPAAGRPGPKPKAKQPTYNVDPAKFALVWEWVLEHGDEPFLRSEAVRAVDGVSDDTVRRALDKLRAAEAIRKIGAVPQRGGKTDKLRLLDEDAGRLELERNAEAYTKSS